MEPFVRITARAVPLDQDNIDTDQIFPGRFLRKPRTMGYGGFLFHDLRFDGEGNKKPEFPLNLPPYENARILVTGSNFGCGSSREGAVWALLDANGGLLSNGFRVVIAPSFSDIFYNNACRNGLLPVRLSNEVCGALRALLRARPGSEIAVDLEAQSVTGPDGQVHRFEIDPFRKECLLKGMDSIDLTLQHLPEVLAFEERRGAEVPWVMRPEGGR
jgi:3-isopropylmalate/(R)-2-methylmalate dehydratase small subunit